MSAMDERAVRELLPAYALGAVDEEERAAIEKVLFQSPELAAELAAYEGILEHLALAVPPQNPPADLGRRIVAKATALSSRTSRPSWQRLLLPVAAVLVIALGLLVWQLSQEEEQSPDRIAQILSAEDTSRIPFQATENQNFGGELIITANREQAVLRMENLSPLSEQSYQLWLINRDELVSAAVFQGERRETLVLIDLPENFTDYQTLGLTIEPEGGSPQPTSDILIEIPLTTQ